MPGCCCCMPLLHNHLMDSCSYVCKNTLLAAKGGCICTPLTPLKSATAHTHPHTPVCPCCTTAAPPQTGKCRCTSQPLPQAAHRPGWCYRGQSGTEHSPPPLTAAASDAVCEGVRVLCVKEWSLNYFSSLISVVSINCKMSFLKIMACLS